VTKDSAGSGWKEGNEGTKDEEERGRGKGGRECPFAFWILKKSGGFVSNSFFPFRK
jgi:hypothetical protein